MIVTYIYSQYGNASHLLPMTDGDACAAWWSTVNYVSWQAVTRACHERSSKSQHAAKLF